MIYIIRICRTVTKPPLPYPGEDAEREAVRISALPAYESQTWLLLEYCDRPCLQVGQPHTSQNVCCISHTKAAANGRPPARISAREFHGLSLCCNTLSTSS